MSLLAKLVDQINQSGSITVHNFMEQALYDPDYGYYRTRDPLGKDGDFTTSPEISQLFGESIGVWLVMAWESLGSPDAFALVEAGPGRGTLMQDILRSTKHVTGFHDAMQLHLVEVNELLIEQQKKVLQQHTIPVSWHATLDALPDLPILFLANEFFDALPVHQLRYHGNAWQERMVTAVDGALTFCWQAVSDDSLAQFLPDSSTVEPDTIYEICLLGLTMIGTVAKHIARQRGTGLIIDYGYRSGHGDSLQGVRNHHYQDVLVDPGNTDLTTHVDFTALGKSAEQAGAAVYPVITQQALLAALGAPIRRDQLTASCNEAQAEELEQQLHRLMSEEAMGSLFKCMAITHPKAKIPYGFMPC